MKPVFCTYCNAHVYNYKGPEDKIEFKAQNFIPTSTKFRVPESGQESVCPNCQIKFVGLSNQVNQIRMLIDWSYQGTGEVGTL
ncbi:MAG: hypothetical protein HY819_09040 [Acidobacteria bacterium]|nr:hypothetical protein [Acidobacteriota bacterium]